MRRQQKSSTLSLSVGSCIALSLRIEGVIAIEVIQVEPNHPPRWVNYCLGFDASLFWWSLVLVCIERSIPPHRQ